jgi:hypothetical protein
MNTRTKPMFPRLRLLMMLFMLVSMASSLSFTASAAQSNGISGLSAEMCRSLDTNEDLNLTPNELAQLDVDLNGDGRIDNADRELLANYCGQLPSMTIEPGGGNEQMVTICHATGSQTNPYVVLEANAAGIYNGHYGPSHHDARDIIPPFEYQDETYEQNWDAEGQATFENGCVPVVPPTPTPPPDDEDPGKAVVVKYFCTDENITVPVVGDEGDYEGCTLATAEKLAGVNFLVYPDSNAEEAIDIDDSMLYGDGVVLPVGTHTLVEEFNGVIHEMADLTIVAGETTTIVVFNPVEDVPTVDLHIYKEVCKDVDETDEHDPCVPSDAMDGHTLYFTVFALVGEDDDDGLEIIDYVEVSMVIEGNLGSAVVEDLPLADFYAVCEIVPEGIEGVYIYSVPGGIVFDDAELGACVFIAGEDLDENLLIGVLFLNDVEEGKPPVKPEKPEKPTTPEKPVIPVPQQPVTTVTELPSTGSGTTDTTPVAPWLLMTSAAVLAGTGALLRKERPAA